MIIVNRILKHWNSILFVGIAAIVLTVTYFVLGYRYLFVDTDLGRDLYELSNIWKNKYVWLGPRLSPGLHASPLYYYVLFPLLWISGGNALMVIVQTVIIAVVTLFTYAVAAFRAYGKPALIPIVLLAFSPWFITMAIHPGNGFTYGLFVLLGLTILWYFKRIIIASIAIGIAISYHPAAIFALPFIFYEWFMMKGKLKNLFLIGVALAIPWAPIIAFEVITKGYIVKHWMEQSATGVSLLLGMSNLVLLSRIIQLPFIAFVGTFLVLLYKSRGRERMWLLLCIPSLVFLMITAPLFGHYFYGIVAVMWFVLVHSAMKFAFSRILLFIFTATVIISTVLNYAQMTPSTRSIQRLENIASELTAVKNFPHGKKIAVVAALDHELKVPQADDYRFFLRMKDQTVLDVQQYAEADALIMFIEAEDFDWKTWSSWEIDQAKGETKLFEETIDGVRIIGFQK